MREPGKRRGVLPSHPEVRGIGPQFSGEGLGVPLGFEAPQVALEGAGTAGQFLARLGALVMVQTVKPAAVHRITDQFFSRPV